jgi:hypothetical protein
MRPVAIGGGSASARASAYAASGRIEYCARKPRRIGAGRAAQARKSAEERERPVGRRRGL